MSLHMACCIAPIPLFGMSQGKGVCPPLALPHSGVMPVSNLWYCMFRAGKRGRRTSAGSLDSTMEVSRKQWVSGIFSAHDVLKKRMQRTSKSI